jgi:hypothetical protein
LEKIPEKLLAHIQNRMALEEFIDKIEKSKKVKSYNVLPVEIQNYIFKCVQEKKEREQAMRKQR